MGIGELMPTLTTAKIAELLRPYEPDPTPLLPDQLSTYLDLLVKWNARTNLTAIRHPEEMVRRHFGESLFAARLIPPSANTLLDLGSGAGFPGVPMQLARPTLAVTLAESQNKKAAFLREVIRTLNLSTTVWAQRSEAMPATSPFDAVALRAVDNPAAALIEARAYVAGGGVILQLGGAEGPASVQMPGDIVSWVEVISD